VAQEANQITLAKTAAKKGDMRIMSLGIGIEIGVIEIEVIEVIEKTKIEIEIGVIEKIETEIEDIEIETIETGTEIEIETEIENHEMTEIEKIETETGIDTGIHMKTKAFLTVIDHLDSLEAVVVQKQHFMSNMFPWTPALEKWHIFLGLLTVF